jgi:hypothetical protein
MRTTEEAVRVTGAAPAELVTRRGEGSGQAGPPPAHDEVDAASDDSFPASDPPSSGQMLKVGPPRRPAPARVEP